MASSEPHGRGHRGVYRDPDGRRQKTGVYPSKRAAVQAAADKEAEVRKGTYFDPTSGKVTFSDYFEKQWLPNRGGEVNTRATYQSHYNVSLKPKFGDMELRHILPSTVQGWVTEMSAAGVKPATIQAKVKALQTVLAARRGASARRDRLIETNPCEGVTLPTVVDPEVLIYEPEQVDALLLELDPWWRVLALLGSETGLRWGELMGLTVADFKPLTLRSVVVRRTIVETAVANTGNGTRFMWKDYPKGKVRRELGMRQVAADAIKAMVKERGLGLDDRLFTMPDTSAPEGWHPPLSFEWEPLRTDVWKGGLPISRAFFRQSVWIPAIEAAGLPYRKFHALRGSHLSWLIAGGADMNSVMARAGHRDYDTTRRYMGLMSDSDQRALDALDNIRGTR